MSFPKYSENGPHTDKLPENNSSEDKIEVHECSDPGPPPSDPPPTSKQPDSENQEISLTTSTSPHASQSDAKAKRPSLAKLCWRLVYDMMLLCVILSTVLGVVHNSNQQIVRGSPKPRPFIPGARVRDYYQGNVFQAFRDAAEYENSVLMFYAPWDRESMQARGVLVELANFFSQTDIMIAAVNCWYPTSDCAKEFGTKSTSSQFPVFIFYPAYLKGIQYRGLLRSDHLITWVQKCRYPLTQLLDLEHFYSLQMTHPSLLVGFTPQTTATSLDPNHVSLLAAANHLLESYPDSTISVAVTTDPNLARTLHLHPTHPVRLFTWNSTYVYPNKTLDSSKLHVWTLRHHTAPTSWIKLPGRKSLVLQRMLGSHSLLVFTSNNMMYTNSVETVVREVSARYRDCNKTHQAQDLVTRLKSKHSAHCDEARDTCLMQGPTHCLLKSFSSDSNGGPACSEVVHSNITGACADSVVNEIDEVDDEVLLLLQEVRAEKRNKLKYENINSWVGGDISEPGDSVDNISGLSCKDNRSLSIYTVDSGKGGYDILAGALGVKKSDDPRVVIVSIEEEAVVEVKVEGQDFRKTLENVIDSWHKGELVGQPGLRSSERGTSLRLGIDTNCDNIDSSVSCVKEVTRDTFNRDVLEKNSSTVLFYTSSFCSHCTAVSYVFHSVSRLLADVTEIQFKVMDATRNDLPWQFTALAYPTVLFFPQRSKDSSRVFPTYKELNTTNLLAFIVSNLSPQVRLRLALKSCDSVCLAKVRLSATNTLGRLERLARRRIVTGRRQSRLQQQIKYVKTVLYVTTAWAASPDQDLPQVSDRYFSAIVDTFVEVTRR